MSGYFRDETERVRITAITNHDGITFEPVAIDGCLGFRIIECDTGKVEYLLLAPTLSHDHNPDNGATADTFLYLIRGKDAVEFEAELKANQYEYAAVDGEVVTYVNHFEKEDQQ